MSLSDPKAQALSRFDLPRYIASRYPGSRIKVGHRSNTYQNCLAVWRGERNPSFGIKWDTAKQKYVFKDFTTAQRGDGHTFLVEIEGMTSSEAWEFLGATSSKARPINWSNITPAATVEPEPEAPKRTVTSANTLRMLEQAQAQLHAQGLPKTALGRCWDLDTCLSLGMGRGRFWYEQLPDGERQPRFAPEGEQFCIPIHSLETGELANLQARMVGSKGAKYLPMELGLIPAPWVSPLWVDGRPTVIVEGPNKGISVQHAIFWTPALEGYNVVALQSTSSPLPVELLKRSSKIYILPDPGKPDPTNPKAESKSQEASRRAGERWLAEAQAAGLAAFKLAPIGDVCDVAHEAGIRLEKRGQPYLEGNLELGKKLLEACLAAEMGLTQPVRSKAVAKRESMAAAKQLVDGIKINKFRGATGEANAATLQDIARRITSNHRTVEHVNEGFWLVDLYSGNIQHAAGYSETNYASPAKRRAELIEQLGAKTYGKRLLINIEDLSKDFSLSGLNLLHVFAPCDSGSSEQQKPELVAPDFSTRLALNRAKRGLPFTLSLRLMYLIAMLAKYGQLSSKELAEALGVPVRTIQLWLSRLEALGFVERIDGKYKLKADWKQILSSYFKLAGQWFGALFERIGEQIKSGFVRMNHWRQFGRALATGGGGA